MFGVTTAFASESIEETTSALEDAIAELDDARENLEYYRYDLEGADLRAALSDVEHAKRTMRSVACSLLLASIDTGQAADFKKVPGALKVLEPAVYGHIGQ